MPPRGRRLPAGGQGASDASVQEPLALRILHGEPLDAVLSDERVQTPHRSVLVDRQQQPVERRQRGDAQSRVAHFQNFLQEVLIDPVEDGEIEEKRTIPLRQIAQQAYSHEVGGQLRSVCLSLRSGCPQVAIDRQRDGPSGGELLDLDQLPPREGSLEELLDLGSREAELLGPDHGARAVEYQGGQIEARVRPERHGEMEIRRAAFDEPLDQGNGSAWKQVDLVEHQHARRCMELDCPGHHSNLVGDRGRRPGIQVAQDGEIEAGALESVGEVATEHPRRVVFVQRDPADQQPLFLLPAGEVRENGGLAESGRRLQCSEPSFDRAIETLQQRRAGDVADYRIRCNDFRLQQPGRHHAGCRQRHYRTPVRRSNAMHGQVRGARRRSGVVRKRTVQGIPRIGELYRKVNDSLRVRSLCPQRAQLQNVAIGSIGDPVPLVGSGAAVSRNSQRFSKAAISPSASRSRLSNSGIPRAPAPARRGLR